MQYDTNNWRMERWETDRRFYVAEVRQDLFGNWILIRSWGSLRTQRGNSMTVMAQDYCQARQLLEEVAKRRKARGYHHVGWTV